MPTTKRPRKSPAELLRAGAPIDAAARRAVARAVAAKPAASRPKPARQKPAATRRP